jgi:hypothetical protein
MTEEQGFSTEDARRIGEQIGIDWNSSPFDAEQFRMGRSPALLGGAPRR